MKLVDDLFKRYRGDLPSLVLYGFKKDEESYIYSELIHNGQFKLVLLRIMRINCLASFLIRSLRTNTVRLTMIPL